MLSSSVFRAWMRDVSQQFSILSKKCSDRGRSCRRRWLAWRGSVDHSQAVGVDGRANRWIGLTNAISMFCWICCLFAHGSTSQISSRNISLSLMYMSTWFQSIMCLISCRSYMFSDPTISSRSTEKASYNKVLPSLDLEMSPNVQNAPNPKWTQLVCGIAVSTNFHPTAHFVYDWNFKGHGKSERWHHRNARVYLLSKPVFCSFEVTNNLINVYQSVRIQERPSHQSLN